MWPRSLHTARQHSAMVIARAQDFAAHDWRDVRADDVGWLGGTPEMIGLHIPDVTTVSPAGVPYVVDVETRDSISESETHLQWSTFAALALFNRGVFGVVVPRSCLDAAKQQAYAWGICVGHWWYDNRY